MDPTFLTALTGLNLFVVLGVAFRAGGTSREIQHLAKAMEDLKTHFGVTQKQEVMISELKMENLQIGQEMKTLRNRTHRCNNLLIAVIGILEKNPSQLMRRVLDDFTQQDMAGGEG